MKRQADYLQELSLNAKTIYHVKRQAYYLQELSLKYRREM